MYMVEITESKLQSMAEHVEQGLKHIGKVMQCISDLEDEFSEEETSGAYGERGRLGMRESSDWWDEEDKRHSSNRRRRY